MDEIIRVLLIDDDEDDYIITRDLLLDVREIQYKLDWVQTYEEGLETIRKESHDVYLIDYRLGEKDGLQLMEKAIAGGVRKPFIMLTGQGNRELDIQAMRSGAADYLVKDKLNTETLERSIRYSLRTNQADIEKSKLETRLSQAQKMESIGTLAGGIAHDFNNILSSILGNSELAFCDVEKGTPLYECLQEVYSAGNRAKDLVRRILTFARQADEEIKPLRVDMIAKEALKFLRASIPSTIEIRQNLESESQIMADPSQIHQIFMNLCTNAAHAMEHTGGILEVDFEDVTLDRSFSSEKTGLKTGEYLRISVSDTGTGIAPEILPSIFDPYFTTKKTGEGTGMGLAMVHGIVAKCMGEISVESTVGKGTVVTIYLPLTKRSSKSDTYKEETPLAGTERILFVDDELALAKMNSQILEKLGYKMTIRTSSVEALELFKSRPNDFDIVITDMTMPNMTGDKLAAELTKIRHDIPIILCTGYSKSVSDENMAAIGIRAVVFKPILKADLSKTIRKVLDASKEPPLPENRCATDEKESQPLP